MDITPFDTLPEHHPAMRVAEEMRKVLAKNFGVTLQFPYLKVRFGKATDKKGGFKQITMVITEVDDGNDPPPEEDK